MAALGAAAAAPCLTAWGSPSGHDAPPRSSGPLLVPGATGNLAYVEPRSDVITLRAIEQPSPGFPFAYQIDYKGRSIVNPTFVVGRGERFRVVLLNRLSEPTITHWHGFGVDTRNDGAGMSLAQPGGTFAYDFEVRDRAGLYWYHPHPHGLTAPQMYKGLFGMFVVEDADDTSLRAALDLTPGRTEILLTLQDRQPGRAYDPSPMQTVHGMIGTAVFVNGREYPRFLAATRMYRFRILNASNARTYRLAFRTRTGAMLPFALIGTDGGLLAAPQRCQEVFLATAERVDVLIDFSAASVGDLVYLCTREFDPMHNEMDMVHHDVFPEGGKRDLMEIRIDRRVAYAARVPQQLSTRTRIDTANATERPLRLGFAKGQWRINDMVFKMGETPIEVKRGTVETWLIRNYFSSMPHAMHLHGFHFDVIKRETSPDQIAALKVDELGRLATDLGSRDTVLVWPGEDVRVAIDFSLPSAPAYDGDQTYLFHCHNLEHEDAGMMLGVKVV